MLKKQSAKIRPATYYGRGAVWAVAVALLLWVISSGEERAQRRYDQIRGSQSASIFGVAQDQDGFLWAGLEGGGVARFDGRVFRRWASSKITTHVFFARGAGESLVLIVEPEPGSQAGNSLCRIIGDDGVEQIPGPDGQPWTAVRGAAYDEGHRLWVARPYELFRVGDRGQWVRMPIDLPSGSRIRGLAPNRSGVFVVSSGGIQSINREGVASNIADTRLATDAIDRGDGSIFYVEMRPTGGGIFELRDGRHTELLFVDARFNHFMLRGRTVWAVFDRSVVALRTGERPEVLGPAEGVPGGAAFVDREGSYWAGTADGLVQIPFLQDFPSFGQVTPFGDSHHKSVKQCLHASRLRRDQIRDHSRGVATSTRAINSRRPVIAHHRKYHGLSTSKSILPGPGSLTQRVCAIRFWRQRGF